MRQRKGRGVRPRGIEERGSKIDGEEDGRRERVKTGMG